MMSMESPTYLYTRRDFYFFKLPLLIKKITCAIDLVAIWQVRSAGSSSTENRELSSEPFLLLLCHHYLRLTKMVGGVTREGARAPHPPP